jgi:Ala-tRNA(Pro) deacylase
MPMTKDDLLAHLDRLGIAHSTVSHPPLRTVADSQALRGELAGGHTKNLFLRDRKDRHFLVTVGEDAVVDLKTIHTLIGASGRVSFGREGDLMTLLGVAPGAVTLFGVVNDRDHAVTAVLDAGLMEHATINAHPLTNEATTSIAASDVLRFMESTGHQPLILKVAS